ncbi:VOC family protein [Anaerobacillus sp. CMMVII]|uniref:VOC family protein n=1 Tax=Anaerobacillus sp. CMMVII TaxID=2755588 RepID=UPI0021B6EC95|nr:VOC family protein [Anaerobacillus sp. CMMVII]MCT8139304.1 VOC family protein [Anaerobacillus sp. CMMVII]
MIKKVEHVAIIVTDLDKAIEYYSTMFNFVLRTRGKNERREMAFISHKDQPNFEIELIRDITPETQYSEIGIVNHLAFTVDDIEEAIAYYKNKGIVFLSETYNLAIDGAKVIFFKGADQELLQLVQPNRELTIS